MQEIYQNKNYVMHDGQYISQYMQGGPDYYIRNGNKIFLFENKDNFMSGKTKMSMDFFEIIEFIDKKLVKVKSGIPQLKYNIKCILDKKYDFDKNYNEKKCEIYAILITHKTEFDNTGVNYYLQEVFKKQLEELETKGYNLARVKNLTVINIDTLITYSNSLKKKKIKLEDSIDSYHKWLSKQLKNTKNKDNFDIVTDSFFFYMNKHFSSKNKIDLKEEFASLRRINNENLTNI